MKLNIKTKDKKGITLVALVVTIIVLILLAGVSVNLVIGNNGIIAKAQIAKKNAENAAWLEKAQMIVTRSKNDQIRWNAVCGESCTHGVEPGKSWRSYQMLTYGYLVLNLRA